MNLVINNTIADGLDYVFQVELAKEICHQEKENILREYAKEAALDGFRPGKVPINIINKRYGKKARVDALDNLAKKALRQVLEENKFDDLAATPEVNFDKFEEIVDNENSDVSLSIKLQLKPKVGAVDVADLEIENLKLELSPQEKQDMLGETLNFIGGKTGKKKPNDAVIEHNDFVVVNVIIKNKENIDEKELESIYPYVFININQKDSFLCEVSKQLLGKKSCEEVHFSWIFDKTANSNYLSEELLDTELDLKITIGDVFASNLVTLNDDFLKKYDFKDAESVEKSLELFIMNSVKRELEDKTKKQIFDWLDEKYVFDVPKTLVKKEYDHIFGFVEKEIEKAKENNSFQEDDTNREELDQKYKNIALRRVKLGFIIEEVLKNNDINSFTQESFLNFLMYYSQYNEFRFNFLLRLIQNSKKKENDVLNNLFSHFREYNAVEFLKSKAKQKDVNLTFAELFKKMDDEVMLGLTLNSTCLKFADYILSRQEKE